MEPKEPYRRFARLVTLFVWSAPLGTGSPRLHGGPVVGTANDGRVAAFHFALPTQVTEPTPLVA
jgi:hypothetical protein